MAILHICCCWWRRNSHLQRPSGLATLTGECHYDFGVKEFWVDVLMNKLIMVKLKTERNIWVFIRVLCSTLVITNHSSLSSSDKEQRNKCGTIFLNGPFTGSIPSMDSHALSRALSLILFLSLSFSLDFSFCFFPMSSSFPPSASCSERKKAIYERVDSTTGDSNHK